MRGAKQSFPLLPTSPLDTFNVMANIRISKMDVDTAWEVPWKCWEMMKQNYPLALILVFGMIPLILINLIPLAGPILGSIVLSLWSIGTYCVAKEWEEGRPSSFDFFVKNLTDKVKIQRLMPLIAINAVFSLVTTYLSTTGFSGPITSITTVLSMIVGFLLGLAMAQMIFHPETSASTAIQNAVSAILSNIVPLILLWVFYLFLFFICAICLFLPVIFAFMPASLSFSYVVYRVLLEGLNLKSEDSLEIEI